jgi:hypothetical protein
MGHDECTGIIEAETSRVVGFACKARAYRWRAEQGQVAQKRGHY